MSLKRNMDGKKRRKNKGKHSTSTSGIAAPSEDSKQPGCDHDLHEGGGASRPSQPKAVALVAGRKGGSSKGAPGEKGRTHKTASAGDSLVGVVDNPQPSFVSKASTASPGGGGDGGEGKQSKKSRKRRRQEAALSLATTTTAEAREPSVVSVETLSGDGDGSSSSSSRKRSKKNKAQKKAHSRISGSESKRNTILDAGGKPQQSDTSSSSRGPSGSGGGGGSGGSGAGVGSGAKKGAGAAGSSGPKLSDLQKRMRQKLEGAQFRMINETLYTSESGASLAKFKQEPDLFDVVRRPSLFTFAM